MSVATIKVWRRKGWIVTNEGRLDRLATLVKVAGSRDPTLGGKPDRLFGGSGLVGGQAHADCQADSAKLLRAKALRETLGAKALRMQIEREEGKLILRADAERVYTDILTDLKNEFEAMPIRVAGSLVGLDARGIQIALRDEVESALRRVSEAPYVSPGTAEGSA